MGHLLFWGSQGVRRNLQAAREMFQQGAEQGDPNSIYNLGLMEFHVRLLIQLFTIACVFISGNAPFINVYNVCKLT